MLLMFIRLLSLGYWCI